MPLLLEPPGFVEPPELGAASPSGAWPPRSPSWWQPPRAVPLFSAASRAALSPASWLFSSLEPPVVVALLLFAEPPRSGKRHGALGQCSRTSAGSSPLARGHVL